MILKDDQGTYVLKVDKQRRIVYEKVVGIWTAEQYQEYMDIYKNKIIPYLGKGSWVKCVDMKEYMPSTKVPIELVNEHVRNAAQNGLSRIALVLDSATVKMQMNRAGKNALDPMHFATEKEADDWLRSQGF